MVARFAMLAAMLAVVTSFGSGPLSASGSAAVYTGRTTDPVDSAPDTDVRSASMTIDAGAGVWDTDLSFEGLATSRTNATIYVRYLASPTMNRCIVRSGLMSLTGRMVVPGPLSAAGYAVITMRGTQLSGTIYDGCLISVAGAPKPTLGFARSGRGLKIRVRDKAITTMKPRGAASIRLSAQTVTQETIEPFTLLPAVGS